MTTVSDGLFQYGGMPVGAFTAGQPRKCFFVDGRYGQPGASGKKWKNAVDTIQAGVDLANVMQNRRIDVDIYIASGYYDEEVVVNHSNQGITYSWMITDHPATTHWGAEVGRLRLIGTGLVFIRGGVHGTAGQATTPTLSICRPNVDVWNIHARSATSVAAAGAWTSGDGSEGHAHVGMPAVMVQKSNNLTVGSLDGGNASCVRFFNCKITGQGDPSQGAWLPCGVLISGADYVELYNCQVECFTYNVAIIGSSMGKSLGTQLHNCRLQGAATADLYVGGDSHTQLIDCHFMEDGGTYIAACVAAGASTDCAIIGGSMAGTVPATGAPAGWTAIGIKTEAGISGDADMVT